MIRISVSAAAFQAIAATSPLGTVDHEPNGERLIWLEERWINQLDAIRMPGKSYSDVILWLRSSLWRPKDSLERMRRTLRIPQAAGDWWA